MSQDLTDLARTDVYLIDQILKGRIAPGSSVLDVGCGGGRNLPWFLRNGHDVTALDPSAEALAVLREELRHRGLDLPADRCVLGAVEAVELEAEGYDVVLSNAVLHFAGGHGHFQDMLDATWRCVAPGGLFFARLTSSVGIEERVRPLGDGRFWLPDDSERYLVTERGLLEETARLGGELLDPIKSTVVQSLRTMTTWVMRKPTSR